MNNIFIIINDFRILNYLLRECLFNYGYPNEAQIF